MIVYTVFSAAIPSLCWIYSATCRLHRPHARMWSRPRPLRRAHGAHVRPPSRYVGRHRHLINNLKPVEATP